MATNLAVLKTEARAIAKRRDDRFAAAIGENRDLTAEEEAAEAEDAKKLASLTAMIQRVESAMADAGAIGSDPVSTPPATGPPAAVPAQPRQQLDNGGFRDIAEFASAVRFANPAAGGSFRMDDRLARLVQPGQQAAPGNVHMEQGDAAGSFLVPAEFRQNIVNLVFNDQTDPVMDLISAEPTGSNRVIGLGDETTPWGNNGVVARWRSEGEQMQPSRLALTPRETKLGELYAFVLATEELLQDAPRVSSLLTTHAAAAIRWTTADAYMYGDGIEKPLGWMNSDALITVPKDANQTAATISASNVARMYARVIMPTQAVWLANNDIMPSLMGMKTEGSNLPLWFGNFQNAPGGQLLGRPVIFSEHSRSVGQFGDLQLVNPNGYEAFRKQSGVEFAESIHLYFDYNIRAYRWVFRIGGQPVLSKPVMPANGNTTKSHFVALAERA
ncbi:phage major capsid protein [uncultured Sphingomonas sp.]|uniref:phage major capsid protein n=1 Tax=uncultured Sphingomonas sp. TaxID=158754 RepID=UPI0030DB86C7